MRAQNSSIRAGRSVTSGFTLIELMVTLTVFAIIAATITLVLMSSAKSKQRTTQRIESAEAARAALDLMARDIRSAGYGTDQDYSTPQPAIAYVDQSEIILAENQTPYPANPAGPTAPLAYDPAQTPRPRPLDGTPYAPPIRYRTGAELIRYTLDVNNDGAIDASDVASAQGADAAATPNPSDYVLVRQVYGDSTGNVAGNNGGTTERVALIRKPGDAGVPPLFTVYMRGIAAPWDWVNGPVPLAKLNDIQRVEMRVTATSSRPDARGAYAQTTLRSEVNAARSVPDFGATTYAVSGYVFNDLGMNGVKDTGESGLPNAVIRLGPYVAYTNNTGFYQIRVPAGQYTLKHSPPMGYGSYAVPDTFNLTITDAGLMQDFADTARAGGYVAIHAFHDVNTSGAMDSGELALQGIRFTITPGAPGSESGVTDASGNLSLFTAVGGWSVTCNSPDSLSVTTTNPKTDEGTPMTNGGAASFSAGLNQQVLGTVRGKVFVDANRNGNLEGSEIGVPNVWVGISKDMGLTVAAFAYTDASGDYSLATPINDPPHTAAYAVYAIPPAGYFPTGSTSIGGLWVGQNQTLSGKNFGMASFQVITLAASRVLSLTATDVVEADWNGNQTANARADQDLILGADAGTTDNVSVWFNRFSSSPLFNSTPTDPYGYSRLAPNSVMAMAADTLDQDAGLARPDLVTGTRFTSSGNFFVWFLQGSHNNEGYLPTNYSPGQNYRTADNGDVQAVVTLDCGGGNMPDIIVGTKSATAGQGSVEVWLNNNAASPTFARDETFNMVSASLMGEVTGMTLSDLDNDGDKDLVVCTHTSDYNGQMVVFENRGRVAGGRFIQRYAVSFGGNAPTAVACLDADGDGWRDVFVGTQRSTSQGNVYQFRNTGASTPYTFSIVRAVSAPGFVQSMNAGDFGGNASRKDLAVGYRTSTTGYGGGVVVFFMDTGLIPNSGTDPSAGSVVNMVPALASANFNYGLNTTAPPSPYLTDLAAGVKVSATTGAIVVFVR